MGISTAALAVHTDTMHSGSAARGVASGVAPLDASSLVPLANLGGITNTEVAAGAAIAGTKLAAGWQKGVASGIAGLDAGSLVPLANLGGITGTEIAAAAAIAKTQLAALGIVDADVAAGAAIAGTKLAAGWQKGVASGIAGLDASSLVPDAQNPAVNTTHIAAAAPHSGHETPTGAQTKVNTHAAVAAPHSGHAIVASGGYTGNETANRAVPHGLGRAPKAVWITARNPTGTEGWFGRIFGTMTELCNNRALDYATSHSILTVTAADSTNFYVGNATGYEKSYNAAITYSWVAIG